MTLHSRSTFLVMLATLCMMLMTLTTSAATAWNPEVINGIKYIPMSDVRAHYKLTRQGAEGRYTVYEMPKKIHLKIRNNSQEMFMNGMKFILSYPIVNHHSKGLMIANLDLHKIVDPVLRPTYIANRRNFNTVILDPGHGGHDSGATNRLSRECDLNLNVAKKLRDHLRRLGYKVIMTRETDTFLSLHKRVEIANKYQNAIFISIHFNHGRTAAKGVETFTLAPAGTSSTMSRNIRKNAMHGNAQDSMNIALATTVQRYLLRGPLAKEKKIAMEDRGIKRARYCVLCDIQHPAVLVEGGFLSNSQEARLISTERYQNFMAKALSLAVEQYRRALCGPQKLQRRQ